MKHTCLYLTLTLVSCQDGGEASPDAKLSDVWVDAARSEDASTDAPLSEDASTDAAPLEDASPVDPCQGRLGALAPVPLDEAWSIEIALRAPGEAWGEARAVEGARAPGWLFPFEQFAAQDRDARLTYRRAVTWPEAWSCASPEHGYRAILEFDSADYQLEAWLDDAPLGSHKGYLERFGLEWPWGRSGALTLALEDRARALPSDAPLEAYPHQTLQGTDAVGWGFNPIGLPGAARLRLVRGAYLRDLYAATVAQREGGLTARVGLRVEAPEPGALRVELWLDGVQITEALPLELSPRGEAALLVEVEGLGLGEEGLLEARLFEGERRSDARAAPLLNRRVTLEGDTLTLDGQPHFARGAAIHLSYRFLPFESGGAEVMSYVALDDALEARYEAALDDALAAGVGWLRFGHLLPDRRFTRAARRRGLSLYQDFPLHWNTDFEALPAEEIERQLRGFLWRVAAEPAVAVIALHNEAELYNTQPEDPEINHALIESLLRIADEIAPHLTVIGCSGCLGTALFPPDHARPVEGEVIADAHAYFGSWWQPSTPWAEIPEVVSGLGARAEHPIFWSEMGNGWATHYAYLSALTDDIEPPEGEAVRLELESWLKARDGRPLTLAQFYAILRCTDAFEVPSGQVEACAAAMLAEGDEAALIAWAQNYFMGDRLALEAVAGDPRATGNLVAAHWLAAQIFEARWRWASGEPFLGVISWERARNAYPFMPRPLGPSLEGPLLRAQAIIASASAPVAAQLRHVGGRVEARLIADAPGEVTLRLSSEVGALWERAVTLEAREGRVIEVPEALLEGAGRILALEVYRGEARLSTSRLTRR